MSILKKLQEAKTRGEVAALLDVKLAMLSFILYKKPKAALYTKFSIPKKHGGARDILAPEGNLKLLQYRLCQILQSCLDEINVANGHGESRERQGVAHGFKRFHTIMTNGRPHVARRYVFNVDLHDFFGSFNFGRVRGFFIKNKNFLLHEDVATVIAQIACHENKLPQGSPCSPVISNLISHSLDMKLVKLAASVGATYTRYADDLTFSTNNPDFPQHIALLKGTHEWVAGRGLEKIVMKEGFSLNPSKTRMQYRDSRQEVTGLTVNRKVNSPAAYRLTVRAMVNSLFKTGSFEHVHKKKGAAGDISVTKSAGEKKQLLGMLSHIDQVDLFNRRLRERNGLEPHNTSGRVALFRRFLYFYNFYALDAPLIVCEGKTDNVYLKCAIKSLASSYPKLATSDSLPKLKIRFFKYSERRAGDVIGLSGGVGGICKLLKNYHEDVREKFKAPSPKHPVIVLIDNDSGANNVYEAIAGITKKPKPAGMADFIHVTGNLYVVPTPLGRGKKKTAIEDFFDDKTLSVVLNGKTFNRNKNIDETVHYGKVPFAINVVAKNADTIDFTKFKKILDRVVKVIDDYAIKMLASSRSAS
ncbi:retron Ec67 family RNA-directed DNA polymerase/endonuclease [Ralstonia mannitolilytica]|uniref:retron Ec67 family RNA-directed DNA polymerase/endonuclease n=1 Tax=Ralstonia mannitolilytica TaxID=105219 RepID=UPI00292F0FE7|nr:retron Ec67 family RNA-directed DNA polymerase/endonuclease [Ralstonia mannitolilytica]